MTSHRDGSHRLATWARRPLVCTTTVIVLGAGCIALSLVAPLGIGFLALAIGGTTAVVAGMVTMVVLLFGRLLGLWHRSDAAVEGGREKILFPGARPPSVYVRNPGGEAGDKISEPTDSDQDQVVDLRSGDRQSTAA